MPSLLPHDLCHRRSWLPAPDDYTVEVRNRFKGLDLTDRVPDELWMEVRDIVQEAGIKIIPKKKKCKMAKWLRRPYKYLRKEERLKAK